MTSLQNEDSGPLPLPLSSASGAPSAFTSPGQTFTVSMDAFPNYHAFTGMPFLPIGQGTLLNPQAYPMNPGAILISTGMMPQEPGSPKFSMAMAAGGRMFGKASPFGLDSISPYHKHKSPRHRRSFKELVRDVFCPHENCGRRYATRSSLTTHIRLKHGGDMSLLEAQELKEKEGKEGQEGSESQEDTDEAKTEGQDVQGTQQPEGAKAKSRVLASVGDADIRPRAFSSGAQLQTPTKEEITADLQLFDILSVDDLALLHNSDRSLDDILELTPHNSLERGSQDSACKPAPPEASLPPTRTHSPNMSPSVLPMQRPIAPNVGPSPIMSIMHPMLSPLAVHSFKPQPVPTLMPAHPHPHGLALVNTFPAQGPLSPHGQVPSFARLGAMTSLESCLAMPPASMATPKATPTDQMDEALLAEDALAVSDLLDELQALYGDML